MKDDVNCRIEIELPCTINIITDGSHLRETYQENSLKGLTDQVLGDAGLYKYRNSNRQSQLSSYIDFIVLHVLARIHSHHHP
jgi:aminopeptidase-like protein